MHLSHNDIERGRNGNRWRVRHAGEKILLAGGMMLVVLTLPDRSRGHLEGWAIALVVGLVMICIALVDARIPWRDYVRVAVVPVTFAAINASTLLISIDPANPQGIEIVTADSGSGNLKEANNLFSRSLASISCLCFLVLTTPIEESLYLLRRIGVPAQITELALTIHRFTGLLIETTAGVITAQKARGGYSTLQRSWNSIAMLTSAILIRSIYQSSRLEIGLAGRGYDGHLRMMDNTVPISGKRVCLILGLEVMIVALGIHGV